MVSKIDEKPYILKNKLILTLGELTNDLIKVLNLIEKNNDRHTLFSDNTKESLARKKNECQNGIIEMFIGLGVSINVKEIEIKEPKITTPEYLTSEETTKLDYYLDLFSNVVADVYNHEEANRLVKSIKTLLGHPTNRHDNPRTNVTDKKYNVEEGLKALESFNALFNNGNELLLHHFLLNDLEVISKDEAKRIFKNAI